MTDAIDVKEEIGEITQEHRDTGLRAILSVIGNKKNSEKFEGYLYKAVSRNTPEMYLWVVYQVVGQLLQDSENKETKNILQGVKAGKVGWSSPVYNDISERIREYEEFLLNPFEVVEGVTQCGKCGSKKTISVQRQTRSCDEPFTTFSCCAECGHKWTYSG